MHGYLHLLTLGAFYVRVRPGRMDLTRVEWAVALPIPPVWGPFSFFAINCASGFVFPNSTFVSKSAGIVFPGIYPSRESPRFP